MFADVLANKGRTRSKRVSGRHGLGLQDLGPWVSRQRKILLLKSRMGHPWGPGGEGQKLN